MVAIQLKKLVSLIALCTLVSSSTIQRVQRADNPDNVGIIPNAQNNSLSTPGKDAGPPAEIHLDFHQPNDNGGNHSSPAGSHPPNRMNRLPMSPHSMESTNNNPDDKKPNSDTGGGELSIPQLGVPRLGNARPPRSLEHQDKNIFPNVIQDRIAVVEGHAPGGKQMKQTHISGEPIAEAGINKNFQDGQQKPEGLGQLGSGSQTE